MAKTQYLLILDAILLALVLLLFAPSATALAIHEWVGFALIPLLVIHIVLQWRWIAASAQRLFARWAWRARCNFLLNILLFVAVVVTVLSGAMTSFIVLPAFGIAPGDYSGWLKLHNECQSCLQILLTLHVAMNWNWIIGAIRRYALARPNTQGDMALLALTEEPKDL